MVSNVVAARFSLNSLKERGSNEPLRSQHLNTPVAPACHVEAFLTRRSRSEGGSEDGSLARRRINSSPPIGTLFARKVAMFVLSLFALLVLVPAAAALIFEGSRWHRSLIRPAFSIGAAIIYRQEVASTQPAADARDIRPATRGEYYYYNIINYLRVTEVLGDGRIIAVARNHKRLCFWPNDSALRKARLNERLFYRQRFPRS